MPQRSRRLGRGLRQLGRRSPFGGNAKLYWNLQWCADVGPLRVSTRKAEGSSHRGWITRRANEIYREVWKKDPPIGLVHEFFTTGGKKMSTSKGLGAAATDLVKIYPPERVRFLMLRTHPKTTRRIRSGGLTLPKLFDEYDRCADAFRNEPETDQAKVWELSQVVEKGEPAGFRVKFTIVADWLQIPSVDPLKEAEKRKAAALTAAERQDLEQRIALARVWLERWAPDEARFSVLPELPPDITLTDAQRRYLVALTELVGTIRDPEEMQNQLYETAKRADRGEEEGVARRLSATIGVPRQAERSSGLLITT